MPSSFTTQVRRFRAIARAGNDAQAVAVALIVAVGALLVMAGAAERLDVDLQSSLSRAMNWTSLRSR